MKTLTVLLFSAFFFSCNQNASNGKPKQEASEVPGHAKNIIFLIGDGMGLAQITAGMYANGNKLAMEKMKHVGLMKTHSADKLITDSAAGATAFSIGKKSYNGAIGVDKDSIPHETIMETAKKRGLATGIVVTSSITHATPACYYAHVKSRKLMEDIALEFLKNPVDFFVGGGRKYFAQRTDSLNLLDSLRAKDYDIFSIENLSEAGKKKSAVFTAEEEPESILRERPAFLADGVHAALNYLSKNEKGFFLLVEGSQIDWGGHAQDSDYIIEEMLEFNKAIEESLKFAEKDGNTLVVVTADHETGGYAITDGTLDWKVIKGEFVNSHHTAEMVPVFAFGPRSDAFSGIFDNTDIYDKMMQSLGFNTPAL